MAGLGKIISQTTTPLSSKANQRILAGPGYADHIGTIVRDLAPEQCRSVRVLLVVSAGFSQRSWRNRILQALSGTHINPVTHAGLPTPESVIQLTLMAKAGRPEIIVAVGGGSVMDAAKATAVLLGQPELNSGIVRQLCAEGAPGPGPPVVAVPTTPGTGAEPTPFATIWDRDRGRKLSLRGPALFPAAAVLDSDLLVGLSGKQLGSCILDTIAQSIEATWSTGADDAAEKFGSAALAQVSGLLDGAVEQSLVAADPERRQALLLAGHYSGRAIAIAGTTLCHALSYPLTLRYGLPHGHACGVTLGRVIEYNAAVEVSDCADPRGAKRVRQAVSTVVSAAGATSASDLARRMDEFMLASGLSSSIDLRADVHSVAAEALGYDRSRNNPRQVDQDRLVKLLNR